MFGLCSNKLAQPWGLGAISNMLAHARVGIRKCAVEYGALKLLLLVSQYPLAPTRFLACLCLAKLAEETGIPQLLCGIESEKYPNVRPLPDAVELLVDISEDSEPFFVDSDASGSKHKLATSSVHRDQDIYLAQMQAARVLALIADCLECHMSLYSRGGIGPIVSLLCCDCPALQAIGATGLGHLAEEFASPTISSKKNVFENFTSQEFRCVSPEILLEMAELNAIRFLDNRVKSPDQAVSAACFHCLAYLMNFDKQFAPQSFHFHLQSMLTFGVFCRF